DRTPNEYYISEPYRMPPGSGISEIYWTADIPHKSWIKAQFRFADNVEDLDKSDWQGPTGRDTWLTAHQRVDKLTFSGNFVQYRLTLASFNSLNTPRLTKVIVVFDRK
ncbi:MAG: hypothetical protein WC765_01585, partial [Phycisphaerae bacterium]